MCRGASRTFPTVNGCSTCIRWVCSGGRSGRNRRVCTVRSILHHRDGLVQMASSHVQHLQKALDQMNLQLHHVISDITGVTGLAIIEAILAGERNPQTLAKLRDGRIKATESTIAKSLVGDTGASIYSHSASRWLRTVITRS